MIVSVLSDVSPILLLLNFCFVLAIVYLVYQRFLHPLARFPGPLVASLTDLSKFSYFWSLQIDKQLFALHEKYGPIVRIGPNDLSFYGADAVAPIYKSGRVMTKSHFYDGFTTFKPNLFGSKDEDLHALRRRQMAHGFSTASMTAMETVFDRHALNLRTKLDKYAETGEIFDLKTVLAFYAYDVLGELAFSTQFNSQVQDDPELLPPINDHIFLASLYGSLPSLLPYSMRWSQYLPIPWLQGLMRSRLKIRNTVSECVGKEIREQTNRPDKSKNLLTQLIAATDPETGAKLTEEEICSEAFAFLVAGSHTTSGTLTLLFYHLLHNPNIYKRLVAELDHELPVLEAGSVYPYTGLENRLPFTMACIRENFRRTPVFTMPLTRNVTKAEGLEIDGQIIPQGTTCAITNYALQHNPAIWGGDHDTFDPDRWLAEGYTKEKVNYLMPFGMGHRACIGRNVAMINILKCVTIIGRHFSLEVMDPEEELEMETVGIGEKKGPLMCKIVRKRE
ncbi:cytochrome P450 [Rhizodiscina lignyota]|uniref:Cytochrome P450 n=1 Tax=Rhizodiscina lignyota TaxID=1504668 RepID=A0A9P4M0P4_9PEZI|nr:cytochrome P450 [Rhizodiscina lignyota]